ncbi:unnamed protein product [Caenorhabditis nigoni]
MSVHCQNASSPFGVEADEICSGEGGRIKNSTPSEHSEAKHSLVKDVLNHMVSIELPVQVQDGVISTDNWTQVKESSDAEDVNPGSRFGESFIRKRMCTDITSETQIVEHSSKQSGSNTEEYEVVHPTEVNGAGKQLMNVTGVISHFGHVHSDNLRKQQQVESFAEYLDVMASVASTSSKVQKDGDEFEFSGLRRPVSRAEICLNGQTDRTMCTSVRGEGITRHMRYETLAEVVSQATEEEKKAGSVSSTGHSTAADDNSNDRATKGQQSFVSSIGVAGEGGRTKHSTPPGSVDEEKVTHLKAIELENVPFIMMIDYPRYTGSVKPFSGSEFQEFSTFLRSFDDRCMFEDEMTSEKKMSLFLMLLDGEARDRAEEAMIIEPTISLEDLIKQLKLHFENPMYASGYRIQLNAMKIKDGESVSAFYSRVTKLAKKAYDGVYNDVTRQRIMDHFWLGLQPEMRNSVELAGGKTPEERLEAARRFEKDRPSGSLTQRVTPSSINEPSELRSMLNKMTDYVNQREGFCNSGNQFQRSTEGQVLFNQVNPEFHQSRRNGRDNPNRVNQFYNWDEINKVSCFYCNATGHLASGCLMKKADKKNSKMQQRANGPVNAKQQHLPNRNEASFHQNEELAAAQWNRSPNRRVMMLHGPKSNEETAKESVADSAVHDEGVVNFITAQVPVRVNGYLCSALIDTGASMSVTSSEAAPLLGLFNLDPSKSTTAIGLGGTSVQLKGSQIVTIQIGSSVISHRVHFADGPCIPGKADSYLFIFGNDVISRLPRFFIDYGRREFHVGEDVLPLGTGNRGLVEPTEEHKEKGDGAHTTPTAVNSSSSDVLVNNTTNKDSCATETELEEAQEYVVCDKPPTSTTQKIASSSMIMPPVVRQKLGKPDVNLKQSTRQKGSSPKNNQSGSDQSKDGKGQTKNNQSGSDQFKDGKGQTKNKDGNPSRQNSHQKGAKTKSSEAVSIKIQTKPGGTAKKSQSQAERKTDGTTRHVQVKHNIRGYLRRTRSAACSTGTLPRSEKKNS